MNWKRVRFWTVLIVILVLPWLIGVAINNIPNFGSVGSQSEWLSFWGSYAGSIIAVLGVYWQVSKQSQETRDEVDKQRQQFEKQFKEQKRQFEIQLNESRSQLEQSKKNDFINSLKLNDINLLNKIFEQTNDVYYKLENIYFDIGEMKFKGHVVDKEETLTKFDNKFNSIIDPYGMFLNGQMLLFSYPSDEMKIKWNQIVKCVAQVRDEIMKSETFIIDEKKLEIAYKKLLKSFLEFSNVVAASRENLTSIKKI
ncbi:hypothetical protein [Pediococcus pentosaceus]|uniref:hypothetical protein n=1 Tax=Pediococcus pentosaceus TaxID=1255 RepID=UPI000DFC59DD|nr:hypothetical protein [Pediococcus pentosaceus]AXR43528.1 hypothetical protein CKK51_05155 [Pediococcus pentosaceus]KAF0520016.1 hypothetical protein GBP31_01665 [Pediococcus pentosaceus]MBF7110743.1 hypothetical protein [Pediococcus pentosaceus]MCS8578007.1 hypothetical protein [Pediococcus pentosaceus]WRI50231.1 hypothetical protein PSR64_04850 [Pediococcus pentosaceus]